MASTPATNTAASAASFKHFFQRISQGEDRHADEVGHAVFYHRNTSADGKTAQPYVVDLYPHTDSKFHRN